MKNKLTIYPAIFTYCYDDGGYYIVDFIDLIHCTTEGKTLQEAFYMAQDAMGLFLDTEKNFPNVTNDFSKIQLKENQFISYVNIDMDEYRKKYNNKSIKKTLTIPMWLNTLSEKDNINFSQLLQEALRKKLGIDE